MNKLKVSRDNKIFFFFPDGDIRYIKALPTHGVSNFVSLKEILSQDWEDKIDDIVAMNYRVIRTYQPCGTCVYCSQDYSLPIRCAVNPSCWGWGIDCPDYEESLNDLNLPDGLLPI
jgi:hypothetical protein